jgi:hypothetical protein
MHVAAVMEYLHDYLDNCRWLFGQDVLSKCLDAWTDFFWGKYI